jgi:hypothetical protein
MVEGRHRLISPTQNDTSVESSPEAFHLNESGRFGQVVRVLGVRGWSRLVVADVKLMVVQFSTRFPSASMPVYKVDADGEAKTKTSRTWSTRARRFERCECGG